VLPSRAQNFVEDAFSANGASHDQNVFTLDGADNNNYFSGIVVASNQAVKPSIDAIQEFKLETHNYGAEFGRGGGAVVQVLPNGYPRIGSAAMFQEKKIAFWFQNTLDFMKRS
jgi:hypothetical protein